MMNDLTNISITLPEWGWSDKANKKVAKICKTDEQKEWLFDYLLQEVNVDFLVGYYLHYAPAKQIKAMAKDIGTFDLEESDDEEV